MPRMRNYIRSPRSSVLLLVILSFTLSTEGERVRNPMVELVGNGSFKLSWEAPLVAEGKASYTIEYTADLESYETVVDPLIQFDAGRAFWIDEYGPVVEDSEHSVTRLYRVYEDYPLDLERISVRFSTSQEIPLEVIYADILDDYEPAGAILDRYRQRLELSQQQELTHVLGHYIVQFKAESFPYGIDRGQGLAEQLMTKEGLALQTFAHELVTARGGELVAVWQGALEGFAAYLPPDLVDDLQASELILEVSPDLIGNFD